MTKTNDTVRLTTAQAIIRWLSNQYIEIDGEELRLCGGGFGIFGHGNVTCLGEALNGVKEELPLYRGQNEQSMGFAAAGYAKTWLRQRFMFCTASAGPGTANLLTSAALAHANRLPMLLLCGDTFLTRLPDPVLQQLENYNDPTFGVNDAFKPVTRFWDRITHPAQVIQSLPAAIATMLDPADCGPAFLGLPQDVQGWTYDYPAVFFEKKVHRIRRQAPDVAEIADAVAGQWYYLKANKNKVYCVYPDYNRRSGNGSNVGWAISGLHVRLDGESADVMWEHQLSGWADPNSPRHRISTQKLVPYRQQILSNQIAPSDLARLMTDAIADYTKNDGRWHISRCFSK